LIEGGVDEPGSVIEFGTAIATSPNPYVAVTPEGRQWLLEELPRLAPIVHDVFSTELSEMERMAGEDD
jgi:hypothetical protein